MAHCWKRSLSANPISCLQTVGEGGNGRALSETRQYKCEYMYILYACGVQPEILMVTLVWQDWEAFHQLFFL